MRVGYAARSRDGGKDMGSAVTGGVAAVGGLKSNVRSSVGDDRHKRAGRMSMLSVDANYPTATATATEKKKKLLREDAQRLAVPGWGIRLGQAW